MQCIEAFGKTAASKVILPLGVILAVFDLSFDFPAFSSIDALLILLLYHEQEEHRRRTSRTPKAAYRMALLVFF